MNLINQKLFDFECDAYHDGEFLMSINRRYFRKMEYFLLLSS